MGVLSKDELSGIDDEETGLRTLLEASSPRSFHDSSARHPPPRCHPGTRSGQRQDFASWAWGGSNRMLWIKGLAGVGKSAIAQTCAEELGGKLGAAVFFSRANYSDDPSRFFTTIAYQLALRLTAYRDVLCRRISQDPTLVTTPLQQQFHELLVSPMQGLVLGGSSDLVVIIDGLDECSSTTAQIDIVRIIASSVRNATTPFLWAFLSRPEFHLLNAFSAPTVSIICLIRDISSCDADRDIEHLLVDELRKLKQSSQKTPLPFLWPQQDKIRPLVSVAKGCFLFASTALRFIACSPDGPETHFREVLGLIENMEQYDPLASLDALYRLIMQYVPTKALEIVREILLATTLPSFRSNAIPIANLLHLSEAHFRQHLRYLSPVVTITSTFTGPKVHFYHYSFLEFLMDPYKSQEFSLIPGCALTLRQNLLKRLKTLQELQRPHHASLDPLLITWKQGGRNYYNHRSAHENCVDTFFYLCQSYPMDDGFLLTLANFDFSKLCLMWDYIRVRIDIPKLSENVSSSSSGLVFRKYKFTSTSAFVDEVYKPVDAEWAFSYILGNGSKSAFCWGRKGCDYYCIVPYPKYRLLKYLKWVFNRTGRIPTLYAGKN